MPRGRDYRALIEEARRDGHPLPRRPQRRPSANGLATLLAAAWAERHGRSNLPPRAALEPAMIAAAAAPSVAAVLSMDDTSLAMPVHLVEYEEMMAWLRQTGIASYHGWYMHAVEIDALTARDMMRDWLVDWPEGVAWAHQVVARFHSASSQPVSA